MTRAGTALRALAVVLYTASIVCFATGYRTAFDLALMGASLATLASVGTDPRGKRIGRERRARRERFYEGRRAGLSAPDAWAASEKSSVLSAASTE